MPWEITSLFTVTLDEKGRVRFNHHARNFFKKYKSVDILYDKDMESIGFSFYDEQYPTRVNLDFDSKQGRHLYVPMSIFDSVRVTLEGCGKNKYFLFKDTEEDIWYFSYNSPIGG